MLDKIGKPGNFEEVHFFPVSVPAIFQYFASNVTDSFYLIKFFGLVKRTNKL